MIPLSARILEFVKAAERQHISLDPSGFEEMLPKISRRGLKDHHGQAVDMWRLAWEADPTAVTELFQQCLGDTGWWVKHELHAKLGGKASSTPKVKDTRIVVPLCATSQIADCVLAKAVERWVNRAVPRVDGVWVGAIAHTAARHRSRPQSGRGEDAGRFLPGWAGALRHGPQYYDTVLLLKGPSLA